MLLRFKDLPISSSLPEPELTEPLEWPLDEKALEIAKDLERATMELASLTAPLTMRVRKDPMHGRQAAMTEKQASISHQITLLYTIAGQSLLVMLLWGRPGYWLTRHLLVADLAGSVLAGTA